MLIFSIISLVPCCVQFVLWGIFGEFISSALAVSLMIIINSVSKQELFLHRAGGFQGQFKQAASPEIMEMSLLRMIPRRCSPGCGVQSCAELCRQSPTHSGWVTRRGLPGSAGFTHRPCVLGVIPVGWGAPLGCERGRAAPGGSGRAGGDVVVLPEALWGRAGSARGSARSVPEHPGTSCLLQCPGLSTLGLQH